MPRPLSTGTQSSDDSSGGGHSFSPAATEFLHKFPAVYIGSVGVSKTTTVDGFVERALMERKPSEAKFVTVSLSLLEIRFVEDRKGLLASPAEVEEGNEETFLSHDTGRIRSMGAYEGDRRFAGYVIKEEGKPLIGHVMRCNSAALMVSFASFLKQACQLTAHQRGGAFYEELSTDESDDRDTSFEVRACAVHIVCHFLSTCSLTTRTY